MKPTKSNCETCKDYETCTLTECNMKSLYQGGKWTMQPKWKCDYFDKVQRIRLYREPRTTITNGSGFLRKKQR